MARAASVPKERRVGQLSLRKILPGRLAERGRVFFLIEQVVDDLEGEADGAAVAAERLDLFVSRVRQQPAEDHGRRQQLAGLVAMDEVELFGVSIRSSRWR